MADRTGYWPAIAPPVGPAASSLQLPLILIVSIVPESRAQSAGTATRHAIRISSREVRIARRVLLSRIDTRWMSDYRRREGGLHEWLIDFLRGPGETDKIKVGTQKVCHVFFEQLFVKIRCSFVEEEKNVSNEICFASRGYALLSRDFKVILKCIFFQLTLTFIRWYFKVIQDRLLLFESSKLGICVPRNYYLIFFNFYCLISLNS